jgi:hypothetical protein
METIKELNEKLKVELEKEFARAKRNLAMINAIMEIQLKSKMK